MQEHQQILDEIIDRGLAEIDTLTKESFHKIKNEVYKGYDIPKPFPSIRILERYNERIEAGTAVESDIFKRILRKRGVRSLSGVTVISLLTKFFGCPGKCVYCPTFE